MIIEKIVFSRDISLKPIADRWYRIEGAFSINVYLRDEGIVRICIDDGFEFDGRSGGPCVDFIAPNLGTQDELKAWCFHDICGYDIYFSFKETNNILYNSLRKIGYGWYKANVILAAVSFSDSWFGKPLPNTREYRNLNKIHVRHVDKE